MSDETSKPVKCKFKCLNEVRADWISGSDWWLCLQWGIYSYSNGFEERGYRFIYRKPDGKLLSRGQARIPSLTDASALMTRARSEGWGDFTDGQEQYRRLAQ